MSRRKKITNKETENINSSADIPAELLKQFEIKHNIRYAFVNPEGAFFYRKSDAERYFKTYKLINNPFI